MFNSESKLFWHSFYATLGAIIFILIFGASYEFVRWKCKNKGTAIRSHWIGAETEPVFKKVVLFNVYINPILQSSC